LTSPCASLRDFSAGLRALGRVISAELGTVSGTRALHPLDRQSASSPGVRGVGVLAASALAAVASASCARRSAQLASQTHQCMYGDRQGQANVATMRAYARRPHRRRPRAAAGTRVSALRALSRHRRHHHLSLAAPALVLTQIAAFRALSSLPAEGLRRLGVGCGVCVAVAAGALPPS
jgi:hypothetical protein